MADASGNTTATAVLTEKNDISSNEVVPKEEPKKEETVIQLPFWAAPVDMRICISGSGLLLGASASMAGALAPKSVPKKTPKADIF